MLGYFGLRSHWQRVPQWGAIAAIASVGILGCAGPETPTGTADGDGVTGDADLPQVIATNNLLCDLTGQIAEDTIDLVCLMEPDQDPHVYQPTPSDRQAIEEADLILFDGYNFAPGVLRLVSATSNDAPQVPVFEAAVADPLMGEPHSHDHDHDDDHSHGHDDDHSHGDDDHSHGDDDHGHDHDHDDDDHGHAHDHDDEDDHGHDHAHDHDDDHGHDHAHDDDDHDHAHDDHDHGAAASADGLAPDPHVWHDASNGAAMVSVIADSLAELLPDQADLYEANASDIIAEIEEIDDWIVQQAATVPADNRKLVTTHDSFQYYAAAYGFEVAGALEGLSTESQPSASQLSRLVDLIKEAEVPAVFAEATTNPRLISNVASSAEVEVADKVLYADGPVGPDSDAPTYQTMLVTNTCTIVDALGGSCDADSAPLR